MSAGLQGHTCCLVGGGSAHDWPVRIRESTCEACLPSACVCVSAQPCRAVWGLSALWGEWWVCVWMVHGTGRIWLAYMHVLFWSSYS